MTETIGQQLVALMGPYVETFYSEAETESYPYAVYDQVVTPSRTKDSVYKLTSACVLSLYSDSFDEVDGLLETIQPVLMDGLNTSPYSAIINSVRKECEEGIWSITLDLTIKQSLPW